VAQPIPTPLSANVNETLHNRSFGPFGSDQGNVASLFSAKLQRSIILRQTKAFQAFEILHNGRGRCI